jgi:hypothetical protein
MITNAGTKTITMDAKLQGMEGRVNYDPNQVANILGFAKMIDSGARITYDSNVEDAFVVHNTDGTTTKFTRSPDGLYVYEPTQSFKDSVAAKKGMTKQGPEVIGELNQLILEDQDVPLAELCGLVSTVEENMRGFTARQIKDAKRARALYHNVGHPTVENFKTMLRLNMIQDCPVRPEHVDLAEKIYGPDVGAKKGKNTRHRSPPVRSDLIEIPPEITANNKEVEFAMDVIDVNGMKMISGIDKQVRYRTVVDIKNMTAAQFYKGIDKIFRQYNQAGFTVKRIDCDRQFKPLFEPVQDKLKVTMNYTSKGEHVPEAERNNRTIKERCRAAYHNLPYKNIPKLMIKTMVMNETDKLNLFPAKGGLSAYFSPDVIMNKRPTNYNKHLKIPHGAYVQAEVENDNEKNTPKARTIDAIYLRPLKNVQGGHEVMNLETGRSNTSHKVFVFPLTESVKKAVEKMAEEQGVKSFKMTGRNKMPIYPADWIAGVDYEPNANQNNDENDELDEDDEDYDPNEYDDGDEEWDEDDYEPENDWIDPNDVDELLNDGNQTESNPTSHQDQEDNEQDDEPEDEQDAEPTVTDDDETQDEPATATRRSQREPKPITDRLTYTHMQTKKKVKFADEVPVVQGPTTEVDYDETRAMVAAMFMVEMNARVTQEQAQFGQQYVLNKGLKLFKQKGTEAALKEMKQLNDRVCFSPEHPSKLTKNERDRAQEGIMLLNQKRDMTVKGRMVYNGKPTRE